MIAPTSFFADYGCHVRILEEITSLQNRGHDVALCTYHNGRDLPGIAIHRTVDIPWRKRAIVGSSKHKMYLDIMLLFTVLRRTLSFKPDIIHAHLHEGALIGSVASALSRRPVVFDYQGSLAEEMIDHGFIPKQGLRQHFMRWLERRIDGFPSAIIPSSVAAGRYLKAKGTDPRRVRVVADAVDLDRFNPHAHIASRLVTRQHLGIPESAPVVVYLGLLADYQGTTTLIQAADLLLERRRDAYVVIAGYPGVGRHARMAEGSAHAARILFPGRIPYDDAPALLAAADVAVAPKRSVTEANGKVLNYMAMRLPTVCTDTPVNRDLLGDLGRYVPPDDPVSLAAALGEALEDSTTVGDALRQRVARGYSWDSRVLDLERIYSDVLHETSPEPVASGAGNYESAASDD
ncbi:MAG: glycosyltransferase family 4 protein [Thermomicrobiales bacterium]